ncbi:MAG TPA: sigma-54-dependent Fis family transcriptional regulator [Candidatus Aminicenantes bacterium]|nr:sigma-54-dependent Fis family transcriptional regulator [Candidatus Aminicenantes bacterium]
MKLSLAYSLLPKLLDLIMGEIPSSRIMVLLMNNMNQVVFKESREIAQSESNEINTEIIKKALEEKQPIIISDFKVDSVLLDSGNNLKNVLCLPLIIENKPAGAIYLERKDGLGPFTRENLEFVIAISKPINLILKNREEFQEIGERSVDLAKPLLGGQSKTFRHILNLIDRVKNSYAPVFISGESGTGKELVAKAIHENGTRKNGEFVAVNCGAIPEFLLESELFGHVKGAFSGAVKDKPGLIEEADGGTFFLDEIGDLSLHLQVKLLRLLQEKEIRRIGENKPRLINVRFISATNKNIEKEIERENFREDLYYRLKIIAIELPPLRERREDLLFFLNHFLEKYCTEMKRERAYFSPRALELLLNYSWPGNIRELQNEIQRCLVFAGEDDFIKEECISLRINPHRECFTASSYGFFQARAEFEKRFLNQALARWNSNRARTAEEIGLSRQGLFKLIKKHDINVLKKNEMEKQEAASPNR